MTPDDDLREQLAAYLDGELDAAAVIALEQRMVAEPWIAREADAMADMLLDLGGFDDVDLPQEVSERLRHGLETEIGHALPRGHGHDLQHAVRSAGAAAATGWAETEDRVAPGATNTRPAGGRPAGARPGDRAGQGSRRRDRISRFAGVAAVVAVISLGSVAVLQGGFGSSDEAADTAEVTADDGDESADFSAADAEEAAGGADALTAQEGDQAALEEAPLEEAAEEEGTAAPQADDPAAAAAPEADIAGAGATEDAADDGDADAATAATANTPEAVDLGTVGTDEQELRRLVGARPAVEVLLGQTAEDIPGLAAEFSALLREQPPFGDDVAPATCLDTVLAATDQAVPAVVAGIDTDEGRRLAHALVRSSDDLRFDIVEIWVTSVDGCGITQVIS